MTSIRNINQESNLKFSIETSVCERVHQLSQKISSIPFHKPQDAAKRYEAMETACDDL